MLTYHILCWVEILSAEAGDDRVKQGRAEGEKGKQGKAGDDRGRQGMTGGGKEGQEPLVF